MYSALLYEGALSNFFEYAENEIDQEVYKLAVAQKTAIYTMALGPGLPNELHAELIDGGHCFAVEKWTFRSMFQLFYRLIGYNPYRYR